MVASEPLLTVEAVVAEELPTAAPKTTGRRRVALGVLTLIAGIVITWVSLVPPVGEQDGMLKVPVFLLGIAAMLGGLHMVFTGIWGPRFETGFWLSLFWVVGLSLCATLADLLPLAEHVNTTKTIAVPGNARPDLFSQHPLGTNNFSLDLLAQSIYGARVSLLTSVFAVAVSIIIGGTIGMLAGYFRGWTDTGIGVLSDSLLAFPPLILLVALAAVFGIPDSVSDAIFKSGIALAIVGIPTMIRLARANTLVFAQREFVLASRAMGASNMRIVFRELLPNVILPVISYAFIIVAVLIIAEGSLSFLGLGLQQPQPTWGNMIAEADLRTLRDDPHIALVPGMFMFITVYAFNRIGERARSAWDAREAKI
ncbi:MAG TPA: ABC transporter permease [Acidimicrobiales bacterium]